jgi:hypothetical protein
MQCLCRRGSKGCWFCLAMSMQQGCADIFSTVGGGDHGTGTFSAVLLDVGAVGGSTLRAGGGGASLVMLCVPHCGGAGWGGAGPGGGGGQQGGGAMPCAGSIVCSCC